MAARTFARRSHRLVERVGHVAAGGREPDVGEHAPGVLLVLRDLGADEARQVGDGGLDAPQVAPEPELHERAGIEPPNGDGAPPRLLDEGRRRGAEPHALVQPHEPAPHGRGIVGRVVVPAGEAGAHQPRGLAHRLAPDLLLLVLDDHPPGALVAARHHAAEVHVAAGERLELERHVLEDVGQVRAALQPLDEAARAAGAARVLAERGHRGEQAVGETRAARPT